jgi:hypothetical protein
MIYLFQKAINIPNASNIFQKAIKFSNLFHFNALQNLPKLWFENIPSGNPVSVQLHLHNHVLSTGIRSLSAWQGAPTLFCWGLCMYVGSMLWNIFLANLNTFRQFFLKPNLMIIAVYWDKIALFAKNVYKTLVSFYYVPTYYFFFCICTITIQIRPRKRVHFFHFFKKLLPLFKVRPFGDWIVNMLPDKVNLSKT